MQMEEGCDGSAVQQSCYQNRRSAAQGEQQKRVSQDRALRPQLITTRRDRLSKR